MTEPLTGTFTKKERLCGKTAVAALLHEGRWGYAGDIRFCVARREEGECTRILVSVPKKFFRRAVRRNLLKRRMREAYRTQKGILGGEKYDIMFQYNSGTIGSSAEIRLRVGEILERISGK